MANKKLFYRVVIGNIAPEKQHTGMEDKVL